LRRYLTKVVDEANGGVLGQRIFDCFEVDIGFIEEMMEQVERVDRRLALLPIAKYQVDPLVQMRRYVVGFQG
ncbi:hypothetical protein T4E_7758, partial [Trichinella pseudospiralis]